MKSNITIAPNIYVRSAMNVQNDEEFVKRVYGYRALNILKSRFPKSYASRLTRAQVEEMKQNVVCRMGKVREHAFGKAFVFDDEGDSKGKIIWSCRCEYSDCPSYEKCMVLPNAVRINRDLQLIQGEPIGENNANKKSEGSGFDPEECSFEPPHVMVVVPILSEILSEKAKVEKTPAPAQKEYSYKAENCVFDSNSKVLVICENSYDAGYFSTMLYKNKVRHRILRSEDYGYTLHRRIADMFWDFCGETIEKDAFFDRCLVRVGGDENEFTGFYDALYKLCGNEAGALKISELADSLNGSPELISEYILNISDYDCPVTVSTLESLSPDEEYDEVMLLEGEASAKMYSAVEDLFGSPPTVIRKEIPSGWLFSKSSLGRPCRVGADNYTGEAGRDCLNVEMGLWGDVDGKNFLTEQTGDAIGLQLYIAEKVKEGDELTVEKDTDTGTYRFCHYGSFLGEFPAAIIRELMAMEGFPKEFSGLEGLYVRNIVTCIAEKDDITVPPRFRESRIWLGLDIAGYAKVLI